MMPSQVGRYRTLGACFSISVGVDMEGVALTLVDAREQGKYGYGDSGYYYHSYRKYYAG